MQNYSIMNADVEHAHEIVKDIKEQYENGVCTCALLMCKLVPEGIPAIDKASLFAKSYVIFRDLLKEEGLECGILVQCTVGHNYKLNQDASFQKYVNLKDGEYSQIFCPLDEDFKEYLRGQFATLAALEPKVIMVDDDLRMLYQPGRGCACPLHLKRTGGLLGIELTREELFAKLCRTDDPEHEAFYDAYIQVDKECLVEVAEAMREGIDRVNPKIPGIFCCVGSNTEFGADVAKALAGEGNPPTVRINNGNYSCISAKLVSRIAIRCAMQSNILRKAGIREILAETDTCPQNRYSTSASALHTHFITSILEGANGAKHWITRLATFEPKSGIAYRRKLARHRGMYEALSREVANIRWLGCRIPLPASLRFDFAGALSYDTVNHWSTCVLERFGFPIYHSDEAGGAVFFEGSLSSFSDRELMEACRGTVVLSSDSAKEMIDRGFGEYLGVEVRPWEGRNTSYELILLNGRTCGTQMQRMELIPKEGAVALSTVCHLEDGVKRVPLFPGATEYKNSLGGCAIVFCGTPVARNVYTEAYSFLNESRKAQMASMLRKSGNLPIYYDSDEDVYMKAGITESGEIMAVMTNISFDPTEEIILNTEYDINSVELMTDDGERVKLNFTKDGERLTVKHGLNILEPVVLYLR